MPLAWVRSGQSPDRDSALKLIELGVRAGSSYAPSHPDDKPGLWLSGGGVYGQESLTAVLEPMAAKEDNRAKLAARMDAERRHLFVAITMGSDDMAFPALTSMLDGWVYDDPPLAELPDEVTTIWAGTPEQGIYATPPAGWKRFGGPSEGNAEVEP